MRVTDSITPAWERMKAVLFRPFNLGTWFSFGLVFFLQSCIEGGGGNLNIPNGGGGGGGSGRSRDTDESIVHAVSGLAPRGMPFADMDTGLIVGIAVGVVIAMIPVFILMYWLGTRGQMMAIQGVAAGRSEVGQLWSSVKSPAGKLFKFHLVLGLLGLVVLLPPVAIGIVLVLPVIREGGSWESVLGPLVGLGALLVILMIPLAIVGGITRNFLAPIMLKHDIGAREAWTRFWAVGRDHVGGIFGFFMLRFVFAIGAGIVGTVAGLLTCCLGFLPVLHQTLMAPYYFFERAWTLEVLASMSPEFDVRVTGDAPPPAYPQYGAGPYGAPPGYGPSDNPYAPPGYGGGYGPPGGDPGGGQGGPPGYGPG